jgi:hypothetical protein
MRTADHRASELSCAKSGRHCPVINAAANCNGAGQAWRVPGEPCKEPWRTRPCGPLELMAAAAKVLPAPRKLQQGHGPVLLACLNHSTATRAFLSRCAKYFAREMDDFASLVKEQVPEIAALDPTTQNDRIKSLGKIRRPPASISLGVLRTGISFF